MVERMAEGAPRPRARFTGAIYLLYFLTAVGGEVFVGRGRPVFYDAVYLISHALYVAVVLLFYFLFKPVNKIISLLAALVGLLGCANDVLDLFHVAPYKINAVVFFGPYCLLIGYLILRSNFLPRILGLLMMVAGVGWLVFMWPVGKHLSTSIQVLGFVAEMALMLWLLVMGVNEERWREQGG
jgi:hypothetical protein